MICPACDGTGKILDPGYTPMSCLLCYGDGQLDHVDGPDDDDDDDNGWGDPTEGPIA